MLLQIISGAFGKLNEHKKPLAQALLIPFALLWGWHFFYFSGEDGLHQFVLDFADCVIITIFAVVTHRIILLGPESVSTWGLTRWTSRETKFCFYLALFILALIPGYLWFPEDDLEDQWGFIDYLMPGYIFFLFLLFFWLVPRISLIYPAIAIDLEFSLKDAWLLTRGKNFLMFFVVVLFPAPFYFLGAVLEQDVISSFLMAGTTIIEVAVLSVTFDLLGRAKEIPQ